MDESGVRVGCPAGEEVVVPIEVVDLYAPSPENRKSVTVFETVYADGRKPIPPFVVCPGIKIMENWIHDNLTEDESITTSPTGYTNDKVVMDYLDHLIEHTRASAIKPWKLLLLDGHITHEYSDFVIKANEHHIALHCFPSHLTHALQPLDVGIFRPWKHYHTRAIQNTVRSFDFKYTISSFFRDLTSIRDQTMKPHTIQNAFRNSGMWPISAKAGIDKMRQYAKGTKNLNKGKNRPSSPALPVNPISQVEYALNEFIERDPTTLSSLSRKRHMDTLKKARVQLSYAHLIQSEHQATQARLSEDQKRQTTARKSLHKGGAISVTDARKKKLDRDQKEMEDEIRKAETAITREVNKAKKELKARGVIARREERERKKAIQGYISRGELLPIGIEVEICDPEKNPTEAEQDTLLPNISLVEKLNSLRPPTISVLGQRETVEPEEIDDEEEGEIDVVTEVVDEGPDEVLGDWEDSDSELESDEVESIADSTDVESRSSMDSIARNADFIAFD